MAQLPSVWLTCLIVDLLRYVVAAGLAFLVFWVFGRERFRARLIPGSFASTAKMLHDVRWSLSTILIFSIFGVAVSYAGRSGILRRYEDISERGWLYFLASIVLLVVFQDTYFYWTHRAMHHRRLFRHVHRVHHASTNPSPWSAYAFSPIEAAVHAAFVPMAWVVLPLHEAAVFLFLVFMVTRNVLGHLSIELLPGGFTRHRIFCSSTTTTHHALHHERFTSNFGLYFTWWDRWMGTTDVTYDERFEEVAGRRS